MQINVALIGYGYWGPNVARNLSSLSQYSLKYIIDLNENSRLKASRNHPGVKILSRLDDMLHDKSINLVVIATPPISHYEIAKKVLNNNINVLVEKPICSSKDESIELVRIAEINNLVLAVDHTFLFTSAVRKIKEIVESNEIGDILYFSSERLNLGIIQENSSVIWDLAPHDLSIAMYILNEKPNYVSVSGANYHNKNVPEIASITLDFPSGKIATINLSWISPIKVRRTIFGGSKKMIVYDDNELLEKVKIYDKGVDIDLTKETSFKPIYRSGGMYSPELKNVEALSLELQELYEHILNKKDFISLGYLGCDIVSVLEACDESFKNNQKVEINYE